METKVRKIGNSVGAIFPKGISPEVGDTYTIFKVEDTYILKPKREDIFKNETDWTGFRESLTSEDADWDSMIFEGEEY
ncbi:antitoxin MazE [Enterococcus faecalis]|uniref:AbrB/MazE/SpoVT family DNA-binding domain-containing protein n=1 Tax=Enterococcus TaxID=1350 RepID=UPI00136391B1|nr:antitoxin MazE [Enterococcus faecalis]NBJ47123.1 antitoxin MazE [Enterococcus faecalis]